MRLTFAIPLFTFVVLVISAGSFSQSTIKDFSGSYKSGNDTVLLAITIMGGHENFAMANLRINYIIDGDPQRYNSEWYFFTPVADGYTICRSPATFDENNRNVEFTNDGNMLITNPTFLLYAGSTEFIELQLTPDPHRAAQIGEYIDNPSGDVPSDLPAETNNERAYNNVTTEGEVALWADEMPSFPGGDAALMNYLSKNIYYPEICREMGIEGTVYLRFLVYADGSIHDVVLLKGVDLVMDKEAIRVVRQMPNWIPAKQNGQDVRYQYTLPIKFQLR